MTGPHIGEFYRISTDSVRAQERFNFWRTHHHQLDLRLTDPTAENQFEGEILECLGPEGALFGHSRSTGVVSHAYDAFGNKVRTIDAEGKRKRFLSDKFNRSLKTVHEAVAVYQGASLEVVPQGSREVVETNTWDAAGRKTSQTKRNGD
ncbi:MAG: hypothetical protein J0I02_08520, partial [Alphaproteobacteria bacterium]|nr:hypothetical protein [Alphaproteobacteria bacterium]